MVDLGPLALVDPRTGRARKFDDAVDELADQPAELAAYTRGWLRAEADALDSLWITSERLGGTRRQKARHAAREETRLAEQAAEAARLRTIVALPDTDLLWLISMGWRP